MNADQRIAAEYRNSLRVRNSGPEPIVVAIEPWATEFSLQPGQNSEVVAINPDVWPTMAVDLSGSWFMIAINEGGSTYEFWQDGILID